MVRGGAANALNLPPLWRQSEPCRMFGLLGPIANDRSRLMGLSKAVALAHTPGWLERHLLIGIIARFHSGDTHETP